MILIDARMPGLNGIGAAKQNIIAAQTHMLLFMGRSGAEAKFSCACQLYQCDILATFR